MMEKQSFGSINYPSYGSCYVKVTLTIGGSITERLTSSLTGLDLFKRAAASDATDMRIHFDLLSTVVK